MFCGQLTVMGGRHSWIGAARLDLGEVRCVLTGRGRGLEVGEVVLLIVPGPVGDGCGRGVGGIGDGGGHRPDHAVHDNHLPPVRTSISQ